MVRDREALQSFSDRLLHDVQVFFHVARRLTRARVGLGATDDWEVETALCESFAVHTRGLADFLFTFATSRHPDDAFAYHFFSNTESWKDLVGEPGPWTSQVRRRRAKGQTSTTVDRFGEQVGHLNFRLAPVSDYARGWPVMQLASELGRSLRTFSDAVDPGLVSTRFKPKVLRELPAVSRIDTTYSPMGVWTRPHVVRPRSDA